MKLYNLYQEVIFEESQRQLKLLTEAVSEEEIIKAIQGKYNVRITYRDYDDGTPPSKRFIQIYLLGKTKANNDAIRAYQINGGSKTTPRHGAWKMFRLDRIESIEPTNMRWHNPVSDKGVGIPPYNQLGDDEFISIKAQVDASTFNRQRSAIPKPVQKPEEPEILRTPEEPEKEPNKELSKPVKKRDYSQRGRINKKPEEPKVNVGKPKVPPTKPEIDNTEEEL